MPLPTLPPALIEAVREGAAVLFLGAAASFGAEHPAGQAIPSGEQLRDLLAKKFLGGALIDRPLAEVAQYVENEVGRTQMQGYIRDIFKDFAPAPFHKLIPKFRWHAIGTTNYDLIIERAYKAATPPLQNLVPFYKNDQEIEREAKRVSNPVSFLKFHGCIDHATDESIPLILTPEQYVKYRQNRTRLFNRLQDWGHELPIVFCGYRIADPNIQEILFDLFDDKIARPPYYAVLKDVSDIESRYWLKHRVVPIKSTFEDFMKALDVSIPVNTRTLSSLIGRGSSTVARFYKVASVVEPPSLFSFLQDDVDHVRPNMPVTVATPKQFYHGYDIGWGGIAANLDARRSVTDTVLVDAVLTEDTDVTPAAQLFVLKGSAGNGKTTVLKRVAWEAAHDYEALVFYQKEDGTLRADQLIDIYSKAQRRIYYFIDKAAFHVREISDCIRQCRAKNAKVTIVTAERDNEWNTRCESLESLVTAVFLVRYLSEAEIHTLLRKLEEHRCLGLLEGQPFSKRVQAFVDRAKRQLLVALHETTLGKPFEEIVEDEYRQIEPEEARLLYLDICTLHQFGVGVRAGLISRVSGVRFEDFQQRLFRPLDGVVDCRTDPYGADRLYRTRHPHVAGIVFDRVLSDREERLNQIIRIMSGMNIDYTTDFEAFRQIIRYRNVIEAFPSHAHGLVIYKAAADATDEDPYVLQQLGLYELNQNGGSMVRAIEHLEKAEALAPHDPSIRHSVANLLRHRALRETNPLLRSQYRQRALSRLSKARATESKASYEYNTRLQLLVDDLKDQLADVSDARDDKAAQRVVVEKVREIEQELNVAHHEFPDDEHILATEAEYRKTIADRPRALKALQNAFTANPRLEWIAVRLAAFHLDSGDVPAAKRVLETVCTENPGAKEAHLRLGRLYAESDNEDERKRALQHFRSSFSNGDANYDAQFWYARQLFVERQYGESERYFTQLANTPRIGGMRVHVRGIILDEAGKPRRFRGRIAKKEASYLFISTDDFARDVFAHASETPAEVWVHLRNNQAITFELGFVARGPIGRAVMPEE